MDRPRARARLRPRRLVRLSLIVGAALGVLWQIAAGAQPAERLRQVGVLMHATGPVRPDAPGRSSDFEAGLRERGWIKGRNVAIEYRYSRGIPERLPDLAAELTRLRPDVIVAHTNQAIAAAKPSLEFRLVATPEPAIAVLLAHECAPPWLEREQRFERTLLRFPVSVNRPRALSAAVRDLLVRFPVRYAA